MSADHPKLPTINNRPTESTLMAIDLDGNNVPAPPCLGWQDKIYVEYITDDGQVCFYTEQEEPVRAAIPIQYLQAWAKWLRYASGEEITPMHWRE